MKISGAEDKDRKKNYKMNIRKKYSNGDDICFIVIIFIRGDINISREKF